MSSCVWIAFALSQLIGGPLDLLDAEPPPAVRPGLVEVGTVRFHPGLREVEVDATLNLRGGFIEFLACGTGVKRHESLLSLDCDPIDLNAAILLLGIEPGVPPRSEDDLGPIEGPRVMLRLRYGVTLPDGRAAVRDVRAEDVVTNGPMERAMAYCGFVYTGSQFIEQEDIIRGPGDREAEDGDGGAPGEGTADEPEGGSEPRQVYAPTILGQLIALSHRPYAILDNPLALPWRDGDYYAYADALPRLRRDEPTPVTLVIRLPRPGEIDPRATRMELPPPPKDPEGGEDR
ncbi:MAG: YdjY domain-containing protein [Planctomycetota bacterium]|jgi:hypothetical protein